MVTRVRDIVLACDTNAHGEAVRNFIAVSLRKGQAVTLSFAGIMNVTSSFVNSGFVELLDEFSFDTIKRHVRITDANRQIVRIVKDRMNVEAARAKVAAQ